MIDVSQKVFREYDIRGVYGQTITPELAYQVGRAFGTEVRLTEGSRVCVGRDGRLSTPALTTELVRGLMETGLEVTLLDVGPTPMTYFASHTLEMDGAVMITGSHNPADQNGFKMVLQGQSFWGSQVQGLYERIRKQDFYPVTSAHFGRQKPLSISNRYVDFLANSFHDFYASGRPLRVAWDPGHGAAGQVVADLVKKLPGDHFLINETIDGRFPAHHPDPTVAQNLTQLQGLVLQEKCDLGVAFDGDGDRLGVIDDQGTILWGDEFLVLLAQEVLKENPGATIIADVKASQSFFDAVQEMGGRPLMWKTGHSLIKTKMKETQAPLAGEMSGHIFFADRYFGFDDGVYAALRMMGICATSLTKLSAWHQGRPARENTPEIRLVCEKQDKFEIVREVTQKLKSSDSRLSLIDGVRVVSESGWWLLRASNTQDVLVVRAESTSKEQLKSLIHEVQSHLLPYGLDVLSVA